MDNNKIKSGISTIMNGLTNTSQIYFKYEQEKKEALDKFRGSAMTDEIEAAASRARSSVLRQQSMMQKAFDDIIAETEAGNDYDPAVAGAAQLLSVNGVSPAAAANVISKFKGNQVCLSLLLASAADAYKDEILKWVFDSIRVLKNAKIAVERLSFENLENYPNIITQIREAVQNYASHQGVELGDLSEALEEMKIRNIIGLMGLSIDQL